MTRGKFYIFSLMFFLASLQTGCMFDARIVDLNSTQINNATPITNLEPAPAAPPVPLKLTGNSSKSVSPDLRMISEVTAGWTLTGNCESDYGPVVISGDINTSFSTDCSNDQFSALIHHSITSPYFNNGSSLGRQVVVTQNNVSEETYIYKVLSTNPVPIIVSTKTQLDNINSDLTKAYILSNDIDLSEGGTQLVNNFPPISFNILSGFKGILEGDGHSITNLRQSSYAWSACLIDYVGNNAIIRNLKLTSFNLTTIIYGAAQTQIGGLACTIIGTNVVFENIYAQGTIASVDTDTYVGGLIGSTFYPIFIKNTVIDIAISGSGRLAGGLIGYAADPTIEKVSVNGNLTMTTIANNSNGGIVASMDATASAIITDTYFAGSISNGQINGGLVGQLLGSSNQNISNSYTVANISVPSTKLGGPIIGKTNGFLYNLTSSYYSNEALCSNCTNSIGSSQSSMNLKSSNTFTGWDFVNIWKIQEGISYPTLINHNY